MLAVVLGTAPSVATGWTVRAHNYAFVAPNGGTTLTIRAGDQVTWAVASVSDPHTVTSGSPGAIDNRFPDHPSSAGLLTSGQTFTTKFTAAGTFPYFCEIHPEQMFGIVKVLAASTPRPTARPTTRSTRAPTAAPTATLLVTAAPAPTSPATESPSPLPSSTPGPTAVASAAPSASAGPSSSVVGDGGGIAAPLLLGAATAIGVGWLLWRVLRQRPSRRA